jgi:hypothetical protein
VQIDRKQAVIADEILIEVSCNYEWDVALTGDRVGKQIPDRGGQRCEAVGAPRAIFRNLDLRARNRITFGNRDSTSRPSSAWWPAATSDMSTPMRRGRIV